ncbi:MAG: class I SAM-dependent methyltransferase, partial [Spirochaetota bacterium]
IKEKNINNIELILSKENDPSVPTESATVAFMSFVLHEVENKKEMLLNIHKALKNGGKIAIIEFNTYALFGPPKQDRISPDHVKKLLEETGFTRTTVTKLTLFTYVAIALK